MSSSASSPGRLRRAPDHADRRRSRARREEHDQQLGRVPGHLLGLMTAELAVAIAAATAAAIALGACFWLWIRVRRLRAAQRVLLGGGRSDLVDFAVSLQGTDRRPPPCGGRDRRGPLARRPACRRLADQHRGRSLRRLCRHRRPPVRVVCVPGREPVGNRRDRDPGARLRSPLRQGARPRPRPDRAFAGGARGSRARDGSDKAVHAGTLSFALQQVPRPECKSTSR